ncbi:MAG: c-type cytochrome, partial [Gemmatimonadota bacterium]|nr:c-type cytochrome [Gemmatimonadota bacterium]
MWRTNLKILGIALVVVGFYTTVAHVIPQLQSEVPETLDLGGDVSADALVAAGERVYNGAGGCTACHGLGTRAPNLLTDHAGEGAIGARCGTREAGKDCKAYLWESLTQPGTYLVSGFDNIMPDMRRQLPEDQLWAVVAFLEAQGGEVTVTAADLQSAATASATGPVAPTASSTTDPGQLLQENGCLGCHAIDGAGPPIGPSFDEIGARVSADRIRRGILEPDAEVAKGYEQFAGMMPKTFGQQLTGQQL